MFKFLKYLLQYFKRNRPDLTVRRIQSNDAFQSHSDTLTGYTSIETIRDEQPVAGMVTQSVCREERLVDTPADGIFIISRKKGIRCGCYHVIYSIEPNGQQLSLGGQCPHCTAEAADLLNQGRISLEQAEAMSLYCSKCGMQCDGCGITVCSRHIHQFVTLDTSTVYLCAKCIKSAEQNRFFKKAITVLLSPFVNYKRLPLTRERKGPYDY